MTQNTQRFAQTDFATFPDRRESDSAKWLLYGEDILPMWVADMDFQSPRPIVDALHARVEHGMFGYGMEPQELRELICDRMARLHGWQLSPESIVFLPGLVCGLNVMARASGEPGSGILVNTPVYPPFLSAPGNQDRTINDVPLAVTHRRDGQGREYLYYEMDFDAMQEQLDPATRLFLLCNPHNPVGRAYDQAEREQIVEFCLRNDLTLCSDEIHADLLLDGTKHTPVAAMGDEIANRTITLVAPSKTFNIPGLGCSAAIIPNADLRERFKAASSGIVPHINVLGFTAAIAAYRDCNAWVEELLAYLTENRNFLFDFVKRELPQADLTLPDATYLAWIDLRAYGLEDPAEFCLENAKVAVGSGKAFGANGNGFIRLNFGCPRDLLAEGLEQIAAAIKQVA